MATEADGKPMGRLTEIDVAKGVGILLVVLGHIVAIRTEGPAAYATLKTYLYQFHMPLFMYLSGIAFELFCRKYGDRKLGAFVAGRANRLLVPFVVFGLLIVFIKTAASKVVHVDDSPSRLSASLEAMFLHTSSSPVLSIWYLWVLFVFSVITFAFRLYRPKLLPWAVLAGLLLYPLPVTDNLYLDRVSGYFIFFALGMAASQAYARVRPWLAANVIWLAIAFVAASTVAIWLDQNEKWIMLPMSLVALPFIHAFALRAPGALHQGLEFIGKNSMAIYLMNTIAIGVVKSAYVKVFGAMNHWFLLYAALAWLVGVVGPIIVARVVKAVSPPLAKYLA